MRQDGDYSTPAADPHVDLPAKIGGRVGQPGHSVSFLATGTGGRPPAAAVQEDAEGLDLDRMLELRADTIEAQQRAAAGLAAQVMAAAVQQLAECRQLWPGGVDTAARLEAAIQALGGRRRPSPATPYMPWASATGGPPCCDSAAGVNPGRAPGVPTR